MCFKSRLRSSTVVAILAGSGLTLAVTAHAEERELADAVPQPVAQAASIQGGGACNPCNPCAAAACNPCNPCAAACNPCAAACNPCNPCAAACNPCSPCNPCAAAACNPCNPCAGGGAPLKVSDNCDVPRLAKTSACNPCNPCAAACNPCNPCNPCAGGGGFAELSDAEAADVYGCLLNEMAAAYADSGDEAGSAHVGWTSFNTVPYASATHGGRYVNNYANARGADAYGRYEDVGEMPEGSVLAKNSFVVQSDGNAAVGPLFLMKKMADGWDQSTGNWRYSMIMPDGTVFGVTQGKNSGGMRFCAQCHNAAPETDRLFFLPTDYRR